MNSTFAPVSTATRPAQRVGSGVSPDWLTAGVLVYVALPNAIFLARFIVAPLGPVCALVLCVMIASMLSGLRSNALKLDSRMWLVVVPVGVAWCVLAGQGHFVYANSDWWVRDAVLLDLVRDPWPVTYRLDGEDMLLRAPLGYYLPAAIVGKLFGVRAAELALFGWTTSGVCLVFALLLQDRPSLRAAVVRIVVFVFFSGMDILPTLTRDYPHEVGAMIEWWPRFLNYSSLSTSLFWVPNHTLPGWIAIAWVLGRDPEALSVPIVSLLTILIPVAAPLTAVGFAPLAAVAIARRAIRGDVFGTLKAVLDLRVLVVAAICCFCLYPYLIAGSGKINGGLMKDIPWVGEDYHWRYLEFVIVEFFGLALLLLWRRPRDPLLWTAVTVLLALPLFRFGPYNDLVMRGSIPALALLAIECGRWLSTPRPSASGPGGRLLLVLLLGMGAVTPISEMARVFIVPRWDMDTNRSLVDVTQGAHYLTPVDQPWLRTFLARPPP